MCAHVTESLAYGEGYGLPDFFPRLDKSVAITPEVLILTVHRNAHGEHYTILMPSPLSGLSNLGCSLDMGTCESFPGNPKGSPVGNPALNTVS